MGWMFAAYLVVWIVFFVYLFNLDRRQKAMAEEMIRLRSKIESP